MAIPLIAHVEPGSDAATIDPSIKANATRVSLPSKSSIPAYLNPGRDGGGVTSTITTPHEMSDDEGTEYFNAARGRSLAAALLSAPERKATPEDIKRWARESGMTGRKRADPLGDEAGDDTEGSVDVDRAEETDKSLRGSVY